jgi:hypothetical protein
MFNKQRDFGIKMIYIRLVSTYFSRRRFLANAMNDRLLMEDTGIESVDTVNTLNTFPKKDSVIPYESTIRRRNEESQRNLKQWNNVC